MDPTHHVFLTGGLSDWHAEVRFRNASGSQEGRLPSSSASAYLRYFRSGEGRGETGGFPSAPPHPILCVCSQHGRVGMQQYFSLCELPEANDAIILYPVRQGHTRMGYSSISPAP